MKKLPRETQSPAFPRSRGNVGETRAEELLEPAALTLELSDFTMPEHYPEAIRVGDHQ
jgi:hypothetical protein